MEVLLGDKVHYFYLCRDGCVKRMVINVAFLIYAVCQVNSSELRYQIKLCEQPEPVNSSNSATDDDR